jgi:uncharacterized protein YegP (UPF0339 family)
VTAGDSGGENNRKEPTVAHFYVYRDKALKWRWHLRSGSDIIADSGQGYSSPQAAERGINAVKRVAPTALVVHQK